MSQKIIFYPLGNAETILFEMNNGEKMLFDYAAVKSNDITDKRYDIKNEFDSIDEFKIVMFTHTHEDHTKGASEFFYLDHAQKYQSEERKKINELWVSSAFLLDNDLENLSDAKIIRNEARYRLKNKYGIKIFAEPNTLYKWLNKNEINYDEVSDLIISAGSIIDIKTESDNIEFFVHAPFSEDSIEINDKNEPSIVLQMRCKNNGKFINTLITGDVPYTILDKIVDRTKLYKNEDRLLWDIYDIPHHCSYSGLNKKTDKDDYRINPTENVKWLLNQAQENAIMIASCDKITEETSPPHMIAKRAYVYYTSEDVNFISTMENVLLKNQVPKPIEFRIDENGIDLQENDEKHYLYIDNEEFIEDKFECKIQYSLSIDCKISQKGRRTYLLSKSKHNRIPQGKSLDFFITSTNCPPPYTVYWKVKNNGIEAYRRNCLRGQIEISKNKIHHEKSDFFGDHYVECYIVKNGVCVAEDRIEVPISKFKYKY